MVTKTEGLMTSNLSLTANRILVDYKDAIQDYKVTDMPVISLFAERFTTETGGDVDITFAKPSMALEQIEDSRFSEMEMALNEARRAVERHVTQHFIYTVFGLYKAEYGTGVLGDSFDKDSTEAEATTFATCSHGGFYGKTPSTGGDALRLYEYGEYSVAELAALGPNTGSHYIESGGVGGATGDLKMTDLTAAMELINAKGGTADTLMISPSHYKTLLNLSDFTAPFASTGDNNQPQKGGLDYVNNTSASGVVGQLYGLNVYMNHYIPQGRFGVFDMKVKPVGYVERRGLTVEEANPGFGITGSYMTMRKVTQT